MKFVWDARKAASNLRKHGVSFEEASTVFLDSLSLTGADPDHSQGEMRWLTFGTSARGIFLTVSYIDDDENLRIISARPGTKAERKLYEEN